MKHHYPKLTDWRIQHTIEKILTPKLFAPTVSLDARYVPCEDPVPFDQACTFGARKWQPIQIGDAWTGVWGSAWFTFTGRVPSEWAGHEVIARIHTGGEACIFDPANGTPLQGLDVNRDDWLIAKRAKGGEKVDLLVEAAGNGLFGITKISPDQYATYQFKLERAELTCFNRSVWDLLHDAKLLFATLKHLPQDHPRRAKLMYGLNEMCNVIGDAEPANIRQAREALAGLMKDSAHASAHRVSAIGHAHIDVAWLWPLRETIRKCSRTFSTVVKYMAEYPEYQFVQSQPHLYEFTRKHYPALFAKIKRAVKKGQWIPEGAMWVEADCNVTGAESLARQLFYGKRYFKQHFDVDSRILWLPDVFGYAAAMPQLLKLAGVDYFMTQKISWSELNKFPFHSFYWEGIDGTRVFTHFPPSDTYNHDMQPGNLIDTAKRYQERDRSDRWIAIYGYGDGGGGPTRGMIERIRRMDNTEELPRVAQESPVDFFRKLKGSSDDWPVWVGELYLELHRGTYTTQSLIKRNNRLAEFGLRNAEFLNSALADRLKRYPLAELDDAWQLVLLNQFHDILPGSSIGWVYKDSAAQFEQVHETVRTTSAAAAKALAARIDTRGQGRPVVLTNSLSWTNDAVVELPLEAGESAVKVIDADGHELPTQLLGRGQGRRAIVKATIPPMGYATLRVQPGRRAKADTVLVASERKLENDLLRVDFAADGTICRLVDKQANRDAITPDTQTNRIEMYEDRPAYWDAWDVWLYYKETKPQLAKLVSARVIETGPVRAAIEQQYMIGQSTITQQVRLAAGSRRLDFVTVVDWHENDRMLRAAFDVNVLTDKATCEIQFGHVDRPTHANTSWDLAKFEVPAQKWVDLSETGYGVALLNDCKYGYGFDGSTISVNLLRSTASPDPDADRGRHEFTYSLLPHQGHLTDAGVVHRAYELNTPVGIWPAASRKGELAPASSFYTLDSANDHVIVEAVKRCHDEPQAVILRMYEAHRSRGQATLRAAAGVRRAQVVDLLEQRIETLKVADNAVTLDFQPFEIKTVKLWLAD